MSIFVPPPLSSSHNGPLSQETKKKPIPKHIGIDNVTSYCFLNASLFVYLFVWDLRDDIVQGGASMFSSLLAGSIPRTSLVSPRVFTYYHILSVLPYQCYLHPHSRSTLSTLPHHYPALDTIQRTCSIIICLWVRARVTSFSQSDNLCFVGPNEHSVDQVDPMSNGTSEGETIDGMGLDWYSFRCMCVHAAMLLICISFFFSLSPNNKHHYA